MRFAREFGKYAVHRRSAAVAGALLLGLAVSSCGVGMPGYQRYVDGDYPQAQRDFTADYANHPDDAVAQFNMAATYRHRGEHDKANDLFSQAAANGKNVRPTGMTEVHDSSTTITEVACRYLGEDHHSDPNCPPI